MLRHHRGADSILVIPYFCRTASYAQLSGNATALDKIIPRLPVLTSIDRRLRWKAPCAQLNPEAAVDSHACVRTEVSLCKPNAGEVLRHS